MEISGALLAELTALSTESTDPAFDLPVLVQALQDALLAAVPSGLGVSITITPRVGLPAVTVTTREGTATVESSLWVPLPSQPAEAGSTVVFYAGTPGALVDLAADLQWALHLPAGALLLDRHLTPPSGADPIAGLPAMSVVHRALGALLAQGRTPEAAAQHLRTSAARSGASVLAVAGDLIRALEGRSTPTADPARHLDLDGLQFGIPWDGSARPGDHICALYRGQGERAELIAPYLQAGLRAGDKCLCLINPCDRTALVDRLSTGGNLADYLDSEQLEILQPTDVYLPSGEFSADKMLGFLTDNMSTAEVTGRYPGFRTVGDMSWLQRRPPGIEQYFGYESDLNRLTRHPTLMCMYDLDEIDQAMLDNLLRTHPTVLHNRETMPSPHYQTPDKYSATKV